MVRKAIPREANPTIARTIPIASTGSTQEGVTVVVVVQVTGTVVLVTSVVDFVVVAVSVKLLIQVEG